MLLIFSQPKSSLWKQWSKTRVPPLEFLLFCINQIEILVAIWSQCPFSVAVSNSLGDHNPRLLEKKQQSQSQTRKQKKSNQKAARGVCQLSFEKASPTSLFPGFVHHFGESISMSQIDQDIWCFESFRQFARSFYAFVSVQGIDSKISLHFWQCPRLRWFRTVKLQFQRKR